MHGLIHESSLAKTVDAVNDALFHERSITPADGREVARWIAARHARPRAYAGTFGGTERDLRTGIRVFTGERITNAAARHILGEECCRVLIKLNAPDAAVRSALENSTRSLLDCLNGWPDVGTYCCSRCSVSVWRHLAAGGLNEAERRLAAGMKRLKARRGGDGQWRPFPFWYTVLTLSELDRRDAVAELRYASVILERASKSRSSRNPYAQRRILIAQRALAKI